MNSPVERRREPRSRLTITQVLDLMQKKADELYEGELQNQALEVFEALSEGDRKTFLRKSLLLHWENQIELAKVGMQDIVIDQDTCIDPVAVEKERKSIEEINVEEQLRLKTWMHKAFFVIGVVCFAIVIGISTIAGNDTGTSSTEMIKQLNVVIELLTK